MYCKIACLHVYLYSEPFQHLYHYINVGFFFSGFSHLQSYKYLNKFIYTEYICTDLKHTRKLSCHLKRYQFKKCFKYPFCSSKHPFFEADRFVLGSQPHLQGYINSVVSLPPRRFGSINIQAFRIQLHEGRKNWHLSVCEGILQGNMFDYTMLNVTILVWYMLLVEWYLT